MLQCGCSGHETKLSAPGGGTGLGGASVSRKIWTPQNCHHRGPYIILTPENLILSAQC